MISSSTTLAVHIGAGFAVPGARQLAKMHPDGTPFDFR